MFLGVLPTCLAVHHVCVCLVQVEDRRDHWIPWTGIRGSSEPTCGCWESNPYPLEEQSMFLIAEAFSPFLIQHVTVLLKLASHLCTSDLIATFEDIYHPFILVEKEKKYSVV